MLCKIDGKEKSLLVKSLKKANNVGPTVMVQNDIISCCFVVKWLISLRTGLILHPCVNTRKQKHYSVISVCRILKKNNSVRQRSRLSGLLELPVIPFLAGCLWLSSLGNFTSADFTHQLIFHLTGSVKVWHRALQPERRGICSVHQTITARAEHKNSLTLFKETWDVCVQWSICSDRKDVLQGLLTRKLQPNKPECD